jgi:hypothetical protein
MHGHMKLKSMTVFNHKNDKIAAVFFTHQYIQRCKLAPLMYGVREMTSLFQTELLAATGSYCVRPCLDFHFKIRLETTSKQMNQKKKVAGEEL